MFPILFIYDFKKKNWELGRQEDFRLACSPRHPVGGRELEKPNGFFFSPKEQNGIKMFLEKEVDLFPERENLVHMAT